MSEPTTVSRSERGFSLIYVIALGSVSAIAALAIMQSVLNASQYVANQRYINESASAAENAVQYTIASLNKAAEDSDLAGFSSTVSIPTAVATGVTVTCQPITVTGSAIENPNLKFNSNGGTAADYRLIRAIAQEGGVKRYLDVVVGPSYFRNTTPSQTYFSNAVQANNGLTVEGTPIRNVDGSQLGANIASNGLVDLRAGTLIEGNVNAYNSDPSATSIKAYSQGLGNPASDVTVNGSVTYTGSTQNTFDPGADAFRNDQTGTNPNVLGDAKVGLPTFGTIDSTGAVSPATPVQTLVPDSNIAVSGTTSMTVAAPTSSTGVYNLGSIDLSPGQSMTISQGTYVVNSINVASGATLNIDMSTGISGAGVRLYVQGNPGATPVNFQGTLSGASSPTNLQIFYNGQEQMNFASNSPMYSLVYAPNASVKVNTSTAPFNGSVVGGSVNVTGSRGMYYDPSAVTSAGSGGAAPAKHSTVTNSVQKFNVLSWREYAPAQAN